MSEGKRRLKRLGNDEQSELILEVCMRFLVKGEKADAIAEQIEKTYRLDSFAREEVYPTLREGIKRQIICLRIPMHEALTCRIIDRFRIRNASVRVVAARREFALNAVAAAAAELAIQLLLEWRSPSDQDDSNRVHIALGAGYTTMLMASHLAERLRTAAFEQGPVKRPKLCFHALSSGFLPHEAMHSPVALFSFFNHPAIDAEFIGLFTEPLVLSSQYNKVKKHESVRPAFDDREKVNIAVTSLARRDSTAGLLNECLGKYQETVRELDAAGWVGDVQFMPYSAKGPILVKKGMRAVTLFDIDELVARANSGRSCLILMAGPEKDNRTTRAKALKPLLEQPNLKVWTHLVIDMHTAEELLNLET